jgi:uncharacterized membrane protein (UPF0127 family)
MKNIKVGFKGKRFNIEARELTFLGQFIGLMFRTKNSNNLLFPVGGNWSIHSFFVFFPFLAVWLDSKNKVLEYKIVKPFTFIVKPKKTFSKLVEIPLNEKNQKIIKVFYRR